MSNTNISYQRNPDMEITVFKDADKIKEGQLFIARKDSVEGRDKAILTPIDNSCIILYYQDGSVHTVMRTRDLALKYIKKYKNLNLTWECYTLNEEII